MLRSKRWAFVAAAVVVAGLAWTIGSARADDEKEVPDAPPAPLQALKHPYLVSLVGGPWVVTQTIGTSTTKGSATFSLGVGGTALIEDYEQTMKLPGVGDLKFSGHGVIKVGDDGKALTVFWFDNFTAEVTQYHGTITDKGFEAVAYTPAGKSKITMEKKGDGHEFKMFENDALTFTDAYSRAAK